MSSMRRLKGIMLMLIAQVTQIMSRLIPTIFSLSNALLLFYEWKLFARQIDRALVKAII